MDYDALYGPCRPPYRDVSDAEKEHRPQSLHLLDDDAAALLKVYMDTARGGLLVPKVIHRVSSILWIVDRAGAFWFAVEELVDTSSGGMLYILPRNPFARPQGHTKLGHPSLLMSTTDKAARIAGEIYYSSIHKDWVINNNSGRYGIRPHQTRAHLDAVVAKFNTFAISLTVEFKIPDSEEVKA